MPNGQPHVRWRRLNVDVQRGKREKPAIPPGPPYRSDPGGHAAHLQVRADSALHDAQRRRQTLGIDPARLLLLELSLLQNDERENLDKLGVQIIDEVELKQPVETPCYTLSPHFSDEAALLAFQQAPELRELGVTETRRQRGASGRAHLTLLTLLFADRQAANAFLQNAAITSRYRFQFPESAKPTRVSARTSYRVLVQFPDQNSLQAFQAEQQAYAQRRGSRLLLSGSQRNDLFDALDDMRALGSDDRRGERLATEGIPNQQEFYLDIDLWHPGLRQFVSEIIREFRALVSRVGGTVTDGPTTVAETLLLARVRANSRTLEALLNYDRVARVDLPPLLSDVPFQRSAPITPPDELPAIPDDGPLACVIDSGVVAGHPLLSGLVVDERDFDSGENTAADLAGHGTHVAGIVVYGDVAACLQSNTWIPHVRILSAKILRASPSGRAVFSDDNEKRIETQIIEAIQYYRSEFGCRVFNLSLGHDTRAYHSGRQLPWALVLDELARSLDVVLVIAAGNVTTPVIPQVATAPEFQRAVRDQLLSDDHLVTDPACALNGLTVGAIARHDVPSEVHRNPQHVPLLVGSPRSCPSPFTRCGRIDPSAGGVAKAIKPDLVAYGGNYCLGTLGQSWNTQDRHLGEPSLRHNFQGDNLLKIATGTSVAAPYVTHVCSRVEERLRKTTNASRAPTANLIRALAVHSARTPEEAQAWLQDGFSGAEAERRQLRLTGYGMPDPVRAMHSTDQHVVLVAEDVVPEGHYHVYELEIPTDFVNLRTPRHVRVTLAYDPPVRGTRQDYLGRRMSFRLLRNHSLDAIRVAAAQAKELPQLDFAPSPKLLTGSTIQSGLFRAIRPDTFGPAPSPGQPPIWYVVVRCDMHFEAEAETQQRYALVASFEHSDQRIRLLQQVRQRVEQRIRVSWPNG